MMMPFWIKFWMLLTVLYYGDFTQSSEVNVLVKHNMPSICAPIDGSYLPCKNYAICTAIAGQTLTIPCGEEQHINCNKTQLCSTFMKIDSNNGNTILANDSNSLELKLELQDDGNTVCCYPNAYAHEYCTACYKLIVQYPPVQVKGQSTTQPIYREPFSMTCPWHSNPPANYSWVRYEGLDLKNIMKLPDDIIFSDNGQQWRVNYFDPSKHNGAYVCHAWNYLGNSSSLPLFLSADKCMFPNTGNNILHIYPSDEVLYYPPQSNVTLYCTLSPAEYIRHPITWWYIKNGLFIKAPSQKPDYDHTLCQWNNTLTIKNFSKEVSGNYYCGYGRHLKNQTILLHHGATQSASSAATVGGVASGVMVAIIVAAIIVTALVLYYWKLCRSPSYQKYKEPPSSGYEYDLFISAHEEVRSLVENNILKPLEEDCNPPYSICWHHRDFIAGLNIAEQIGDCILKKSRKIVFVFSKNFGRSQFCNMELNHALHRLLTTHTRCIIPITLNESDVPSELKKMLTYWPIVYTDDDDFIQKTAKLIDTYTFNSTNVLRVFENEEHEIMMGIDDVLQIPQGKCEDVLAYLIPDVCGENDDEYERYGTKLVVNYWIMRCPNASWRWLIWEYDKTDEKGRELASRLQPYAENLTDSSVTLSSVSRVVSTVSQMSALQNCFDIPPGRKEEIEQSISSEAQCREEMIKYWLNYSPFASWEWLAGSLCYNKEERALKAAMPFVKTISEPSLTTDNLKKVFDEAEDWCWRYKHIFKKLQIPKIMVQQALPRSEDTLHNSDPPSSSILAKLFLDSHPAPSWKLVAQALYSEEQWEAVEIIHTKYHFRGLNLEELCIEAISVFLNDTEAVQSLPLPSALKYKLIQMIETYPVIKLGSLK